eukprot:TRINITY_DN2710_c0_g2_i10.p4 TRINITY_DN2710_c0_g2~~TRINITY_DN2710_c0_g2_i10.p4  ORF type:complete len:102 (+),score=42.38 TRINITY_DN2710_c0_g2_i10:231-536(+)
MNEIEKYANENVCTMILGNKSDMGYKRQIEYEKGAKLAKQYNIPFMEVSAKEAINVEEAFSQMIKEMHAKNQARTGQSADSKKGATVLTISSDGKTSQCCQ